MKIALIGYMGSGKTTIGQALAKALTFNMIEMDWMILQSQGCQNMAELFEKGGELLLRESEIEIAKDWRDIQNTVISTGGGVVLNKIIIDYLKDNNGKIIFLNTSFETLQKRIEQDPTPRPLFQNIEEARQLYDFRLPLYKRYADSEVLTDNKSIVDIVLEIKDFLKK